MTESRHGFVALGVLAAVVYLWTAPGRIQFPDDEIVFQTAASLWDDGDLDIPGISRRTGEPQGRPTGTFGWAPGPDGQRYGFFGHGLAVVAVPMYAVATATASVVPHTWSHAVRSDHPVFHRREHHADWTRLVVSLTNCLVTAVTVWLLARWLVVLGFAQRTALVTGLAYAFATMAWAYSRTFLSEPLSALCVVAAAYTATRGRQTDRAWWLVVSGALTGFSLHVHVLNVTAGPGLAVLALWRRSWRDRGVHGWLIACGLAVVALGVGHWLRFGHPLETGRFGHYSHFVAPWEGLVAQLVAPGRSVLVYSPALVLGLAGWGALRRRLPLEFWFLVSVIGLRWLVISTRSDWFGGWGLGARHLVPVLPLAMLSVATAFERCSQKSAVVRVVWRMGLGAAVGVSGYLAVHSICEWMWRLNAKMAGQGTVAAVHWDPSASPWVGFYGLQVDVLAHGALRLAGLGHWGLWALFLGLAGVGLAAAWRLGRGVAQDPQAR